MVGKPEYIAFTKPLHLFAPVAQKPIDKAMAGPQFAADDRGPQGKAIFPGNFTEILAFSIKIVGVRYAFFGVISFLAVKNTVGRYSRSAEIRIRAPVRPAG